ncbi:biotinidase-related [Anaeramoeba flamelloides]|uniref:Biotinidase-related n=1 Tax=Anaeramoeba flamelloides TaxID=1746091 RepID=A0ABQ8ZD19_9EUKA|nr:biotinidase-related [Anaeramoeba flamelloides]
MKKILFLIIIQLFYTALTSGTYRASVLEYNTVHVAPSNLVTKSEANTLMEKNIEEFKLYIEQSKLRGSQIMVFPEFSLTGFSGGWTREKLFPYLELLPEITPGDYYCNPCLNRCGSFNLDKDSRILKQLSCVARNYSMVLVVAGLNEYVPCSRDRDQGCPSDGKYQYNTAVAFDEQGYLIAKYHKTHLYVEELKLFDKVSNPQPVYFKTSFGVTFGMIVCFDIMFPNPIVDYVHLGINNFIFSTFWNNVLPTITSSQMELAVSKVARGNLLASNHGDLAEKSSGSGIFTNGEIISFWANPTSKKVSKLLVGDLLKNPIQSSGIQSNQGIANGVGVGDGVVVGNENNNNNNNNAQKTVNIKLDNLVANKKPKFIKFKAEPGNSDTITLENENIQCSLNYKISSNSDSKATETFALFAYQGEVFIKGTSSQYCGLMKCNPDPKKIYDCEIGNTIESNTIFESFQLTTKMSSDKTIFLFASSNGNQLINQNNLETTKNSVKSRSGFETKLLTVTFCGRDWNGF